MAHLPGIHPRGVHPTPSLTLQTSPCRKHRLGRQQRQPTKSEKTGHKREIVKSRPEQGK